MVSCFKLGAAYSFVLSVATLSGCFSANQVLAQVTPDRTLGAESSVVNPNGVIKGLPSDRIEGGAKRGANLFHSFLDFNVAAGRGVYFANPAGVGNIFSRVTGSNASTIAGKLGVLGAANLFLLNPHGIIFTQSASLDIAGSFVASSAQNLLMADGTTYSATSPTSSLLTVSVPLGVQFGAGQPAAIVNNGNLTTGGNLALVGGTVVSTGQLNAPTGNVVVATLPADSAVNLSPAGQLLSVSTPAAASPTTPLAASLVPLAQGNGAATGLTLNDNGQVQLAGSGLPVVEGDVAVRQLTGQTATLSANHNLTLVESQLQTTGDLNLLAKDTVTVRDSVAAPFVASAGGQLLVQGNQAVDIFALNNATSGLFSGGDMVLRSSNTIGGDAHYSAEGSFKIETLDGSAGSLYSPNDPVIRSSGDVTFESYTGASLHIFAGGSVNIMGIVKITGAGEIGDLQASEEAVDLLNPVGSLATNSIEKIIFNGEDTEIKGNTLTIKKSEIILDVRAGTTAFGNPLLTSSFQGADNIINPNPPSLNSPGKRADIAIGSIDYCKDGCLPGAIFLTNQYKSEQLPDGSITVGGIVNPAGPVVINSKGNTTIKGPINLSTGNNAPGGTLTLLSEGTINTGGTITTGSTAFSAKPININAGGDIDINGPIKSDVREGSKGSASDINIISRSGYIHVNAPLISQSTSTVNTSDSGNGGNILLNAYGEITTQSLSSLARNDVTKTNPAGFPGNSGNVTLTSRNGSIDTTNGTITSLATNGVGGDVALNAKGNIYLGSISDTSNTPLLGGSVFVTSQQNSIYINKATLDITNNNVKGVTGNIEINAPGTVSIINSSALKSSGNDGFIFIGSNGGFNSTIITPINNISPAGILPAIVTINNSSLLATSTVQNGDNASQSGRIQIAAQDNTTPLGGQINITNSDLNTNASGDAVGGRINIDAHRVSLTNSSVRATTTGTGVGGDINIGIGTLDPSINIGTGILDPNQRLGILHVTDSLISTSTTGSGAAGNIAVNTTDSVTLAGKVLNNPSVSNQPVGLAAQATAGVAVANAGNISVTTSQLNVIDGAAINVSSGKGIAGNLYVFADQVFLNQGTLSANTGKASANGDPSANIFLLGKGAANLNPDPTTTLLRAIANNESPQQINDRLGDNAIPPVDFLTTPINFLIMENGSQITATADPKSDASGGNVFIKTQVLLATQTGNKIAANAGEGKGGNIYIFAKPLGVYNIEFRSTGTTSLNDITATSLSGASGIVNIAIPDINPSRGLNQLPVDVADASKQIRPICPLAGRPGAANQFVISGRGGLPETPGSALNTSVLVGEQPTVATQPTSPDPSVTTTPTPTNVEAQGVRLGADGAFILTANPTSTQPYAFWQPALGCPQP